jgi:hypothetical protein
MGILDWIILAAVITPFELIVAIWIGKRLKRASTAHISHLDAKEQEQSNE